MMMTLLTGPGTPSYPDDEREEDLHLARAIVHGDTDAFDRFYERFVDRLYTMIYYHLGAQTPDAEDVLQETWLAAIKSLPAFHGKARLFTWLCSIAQHKIVDHRRRRGDKTAAPLYDDQARQNGDNHIGATETRLVIRQALGKLPASQQQVLLLKYIQGLSVGEIAAMTGRSPKAVESLLSRAREGMRAALERENSYATG